ncbi:uncharacterized protein LOC122195854 [Lactuca sativa]|uniref:uncharacterized protein LOC122195854 n=1 Tax=Lactuca sativa TaxID=4236 RepID=UPI001C688E94|nr:uncharacterized protein LOC122195854 [Lactuca sativa]
MEKMEKSRSFPEYSSSSHTKTNGSSGFKDQSRSYAFNGPITKDGETKRKKRIAEYNMFTTGSKLKSTVRDSFKWIKNKFTDVRYGI